MRLRPTHVATVTKEVKTGENELGSPLYDQQAVLEAPCRFHSPEGQSYTRTASGELVQEQPTVVLPTHGRDPDTGSQLLVGDILEEGAEVSLESRTTGRDWTADTDATFAVDNVDIKRRRGGRPERAELTVQRNP